MMRSRSLLVVTCLVLVLAAAGAAFAFRAVIRDAVVSRLKPQLPEPQLYVPQPAAPVGDAPSPNARPVSEAQQQPTTMPAPKPVASTGVNLAVPFTSQAPHADWSMPYQEACEEASLVMVNAFMKGSGAFTPDDADRQILELVAWEKNRFGYYEDTTAEEVATIAREYFGYTTSRSVAVSSMAEVKAWVDKGVPVILPAAGRELHNPNFSGVGPLYHMLVVKGYTKDGKIITNDPGTRRGADFLYAPDVLWNALHDWNGGDVENGAKRIVILQK